MVETNAKVYLRPSSVEEAWTILNERGERAKLVGGGADVVLYASSATTTLVDLDGLPLKTIERGNDGLVIGSGVTFTELLESPVVAGYLHGVVTDMLRGVGSPLLRNLATVGGTLGSAHPWSDVIPLFVSLGAMVTLHNGTTRTVALEDLIADRPLLHRCVITHVRLPIASPRAAAAFLKFGRTKVDVGLLNCACFAAGREDKVETVRITVGGAPAIAQRVPAAEAVVLGNCLDAEVIAQAAAAGAEAVDVRNDRRASGEYRRTLTAVGIRRCLERIGERWGETA